MEFIRRCGGAVTFERFMREALYHPDSGYYSQHITNVGREGDFSTTTTLNSILGDAVAAWLVDQRHRLFGDTPCAVIELGPGNGALLRQVHQALEKEKRIEGFSFCAVETSPVFRAGLRRSFQGAVEVCDTLAQALELCDGRALIYSNEFVDAFPAVQLAWRKDDWREIYVGVDDGEPHEWSKPLLRGIDADAPTRVREDLRIFVHPSYHAWLRRSLSRLKLGAVLTIDYGKAYPSTECRAYRRHERLEGMDIFAHMGEQDVTCDVNFTDLRRWGEQLGLRTRGMGSQAEFLEKWVPDLAERVQASPAAAFVADPFGAGGAFYVLEQVRPHV
ncbi:SAM-dependent methyltransferase [Ruficoccus sp. ZRK36]|uniref:SAM-dependent methyltransferase n=1 Tax=Ruficoccus sp. ZRK36 TaxID=2866311 RepID=UPI001C732EE0|nr:SAM-dependent methyltransferase [Ruficoccus sp. ZRK36]QYY36781.1 SAM-dependent methyltransferase [Ruficoccus sp. ZRK36]